MLTFGENWYSGVGQASSVFFAEELHYEDRLFTRGGAWLLLCCMFCASVARGQVISTAAGNGMFNYGGDGGAATAASVEYLHFSCTDTGGNIYAVDNFNARVRKVSPAGVITTFAGNGTAGYGGDGAVATAAEMDSPEGITADRKGNVYIADGNNSRIRKVDAAGIITTIAGTGAAGYGGDGGPATAALLNALLYKIILSLPLVHDSLFSTRTLPRRFKNFIPYIQKWGLGDDLQRRERLAKITSEEKAELLGAVLPCIQDIDDYLDKQKEPLSDIATALGNLAQAAVEMNLR